MLTAQLHIRTSLRSGVVSVTAPRRGHVPSSCFTPITCNLHSTTTNIRQPHANHRNALSYTVAHLLLLLLVLLVVFAPLGCISNVINIWTHNFGLATVQTRAKSCWALTSSLESIWPRIKLRNEINCLKMPERPVEQSSRRTFVHRKSIQQFGKV